MIIAYNATRSEVTGYSPYFLMFGCRPRLPVDLFFPTVNNREWTHTIDEYMKTLYKRPRECLKLAQESALKKQTGKNGFTTGKLEPWSCGREIVY